MIYKKSLLFYSHPFIFSEMMGRLLKPLSSYVWSLLLSASVAICLQAGDYVRPIYKGTVLTPENLISLLRKVSVMSVELQERADSWKNDPVTNSLLHYLINGSLPNSQYRVEHQLKNKRLDQEGYLNESNHNFVFRIPITDENGKTYRAFIAGKMNKICNVMASNGIYGKQMTEEEFNAVPVANTYQTVSRGLGSLMFGQSKEDNNATSINTPKTYVIQLAEGDETKPVDETTIILQEEVENATPIKRCSEITEKELKDVYVVTRDVPIWNRPDLVRSEDGTLYALDLEQPNNTPKFMERPRDGHERLATISLQELIKFCEPCREHMKLLKELIASDRIIQQFHCYNDLVNSVDKAAAQHEQQAEPNEAHG